MHAHFMALNRFVYYRVLLDNLPHTNLHGNLVYGQQNWQDTRYAKSNTCFLYQSQLRIENLKPIGTIFVKLSAS